MPLPDENISVVRRADGSGTTFLFTNYLSKVNAEWKDKAGEGTAVNWPVGAGGKGNEGVAAFVLASAQGWYRLRGVRLRQEEQDDRHVLMKNKDGEFVQPDDRDLQGRRSLPSGTSPSTRSLPSSLARPAWPITGATFILMHKAQDKPASGDRCAEVLRLGLCQRRQDGRRPRVRALPDRWSSDRRAIRGPIKDAAAATRCRSSNLT